MSKEQKINIVLGWLKMTGEFPPEYIAERIVEELDGTGGMDWGAYKNSCANGNDLTKYNVCNCQ